MSTQPSLAMAYANLRATIDMLVTKLGNDNFARSVVVLGARDAMGLVMPPSYRQGYKTPLSFCEPLMAAPEQLQAAAVRLASVFSLRTTEARFSGKLGRGQLVVRGKALFYETPEAASMFAHSFLHTGSAERWTVALTKDAEVYLTEHNLPKPSVTVAHTKSEEAALKALLRFADQHFRVTLEQARPAAA